MNLLGRPELDPLTVFVRETAQNSWDARDGSGRPVEFSIAGRTFDSSLIALLRDSVFTNRDLAAGTHLDTVLNEAVLDVLCVTDRNTSGLGGPLLANAAEPSDIYDWVDFVLNIGNTAKQSERGGTYGFGKTIAYVISQVNSVLIYSRARYGGKTTSRLIACAIGDKFESEGNRFTGRHWWTAKSSDSPTPIVDDEADALAGSLGLPLFGEGELGTTVMVIAPDFGGRTAEQAMTFLAETALVNLWPKLTEFDNAAAMKLTISWNGREVPIPSPEQRPPLDAYVGALAAIRNPASEPPLPGTRVEVIGRLRGPREVGDLATVPFAKHMRVLVDDGHDPNDPDSPASSGSVFENGSHHIALMRSPELIVQYLEGPPAPESHMEWAGVFRVRDDVDWAFAQSEPPTHDSWRPELIEEKTTRSIVKKAIADAGAAVAERWGPSAQHTTSTSSTSTSAVAIQLAHLVGATPGSGPGTELPPRSGSRSRSTSLGLVELVDSGPTLVNEKHASTATFRVAPASGEGPLWLEISVGVALDQTYVDQGLDDALRLSHAIVDKTRLELSGRTASIQLEGESHIQLFALRSKDSSIMFDAKLATTSAMGIE